MEAASDAADEEKHEQPLEDRFQVSNLHESECCYVACMPPAVQTEHSSPEAV